MGLPFQHHRSLHVNTSDAHRLLHLAKDEGRQDELKEALLASYFVHGGNVADHDTLRKLATDSGLDSGRVERVLASSEYADDVQADIDQAHAYGVTGVPFFVVDGKYAVAGAQPVETFTQVLERAWADSHPTLQRVSGDGGVCGPDRCAT